MSEFIIVRINGPQGNQPVQAGDLDLLALAGKLVRRLDPVSPWLWSRLSATTQTAIGGPAGPGGDPSPWKESLLTDLESLAGGALIYDATRFQKVPLTPAAKTLLDAGATGGDLVRLNRLILASAYLELRPGVQLDDAPDPRGKTDAIILVGTPGIHRVTVSLPGAETRTVTVTGTSASRPLEITISVSANPA